MKTAKLLGALALIGVAAVGDVGCVARARAGVYAEASPPIVFVEPPTLIEIDAGVWVVRDYDYPVYYYGNAYWAYYGDVWYRSDTYDGGWARTDFDIVPTVIVRRNHSAYVHYQGTATARTRVGPRGPQMSPASADRPDYVSEPTRRGPPERAVEPRRGPPERAVEPRRGPPERADEPRRGPPQRADEPRRGPPERADEPRRGPPERAVEPRGGPPERGQQGNDRRGQKKAGNKNKNR